MGRIADDVVITVVPIGGFSQNKRIQDTAWAFEKILKANIAIAAVLDRDFRSPEEVTELLEDGRKTVPYFHIFNSKEIENYLLVPTAITAALQQKLKERKSQVAVSLSDISQMLKAIVADQKADLLGQYVSNRVRYFATRSAKDASTVVKEAIAQLEQDWLEPVRRLAICSGKKALAALNGQLHQKFGMSVTSNQIIKHLQPADVGDLIGILHDLDQFAKAPLAALEAQHGG